MGCCGKTISKGKDIAVGTIRHAVGIKYEHTDERIRTCWTCDEQTWLSGKEYMAWLFKNGIEVLENFTQLEKLPKLPKHEQEKGRRRLYCRICKCFIPGKARVENENCPLGKWEK